MSDEKFQPPEESKWDKGHALVKGAIGAIPIAGGAGAELFQMIVTPPLEKRRQEWMEDVGRALNRLHEEEKIEWEAIQDDPAFITAVMHASQVAIRNHQEEKRNALRNAVLNIALGKEPDEIRQLIFLNLIDRLTVTHLRMLKVFQAPDKHVDIGNITMGSLSTIVKKAFPELASQRELYDKLWSDIVSNGLVTTPGLHTTMGESSLLASRTSDLGNRFLRFIEADETS